MDQNLKHLAPLLFVAGVSALAAAQGPSGLTAPEIAERMVQAQNQSRQQAQAYVAERKYQVAKKQNDHKGPNKSEITAEISFLPPGQKSFAIKKSSGGMAENVVRKTLEHEATVARNPGISSVTPDNYDFELLGQTMLEGRLCYVLKLLPKRESKDLIKGHVWVDAERFMVRRAEGKLAKNPSWWVKDVAIRVEYNDVDGTWLQTASTATAKIRLAGDYTLNSQHVRLHRAEVSAAALAPLTRNSSPGSSKKRRVLRSEPDLAGSATIGRE